MEVRVHGKNMQVSEDLKEITTDRVEHASRIIDSPTGADVEFTEHGNPRAAEDRFTVEITSTIAGHTVRVESSEADARSALDRSADRFERRLRRLKERLIQRKRTTDHKLLNEVLSQSEDFESEELEIVRVKRFSIKPMTTVEAALQMEMLGHSFFFFQNAESGAHCVLYHRRDGSLGLIEAE